MSPSYYIRNPTITPETFLYLKYFKSYLDRYLVYLSIFILYMVYYRETDRTSVIDFILEPYSWIIEWNQIKTWFRKIFEIYKFKTKFS